MGDILQNVVRTLREVVENITRADPIENTNGTKIERTPSTPEGMVVAYGSLVIMAMLPIFFGSFRSVRHHQEQKDSGEKPDRMTQTEAMTFPIIASCTLFALYIVFKIFSKDLINYLLTIYFFILGVIALSYLLSPIVSSLVPTAIPKIPYQIVFQQGEGNKKKYFINYKFSSHDVVCLIISTAIGVWYLLKKHWIANNLFGLAFAVNGVALLHLNNVVTGCILLGGLFFYDIFWVFGTNVMVTVAKSFEAPIKLVFPQDLLEHGLHASNFAMLGLGDIVIPGIFIALLLRFDNSLKRKTKIYFYATFIAYFAGLLLTIGVMHVFKHAQPALLYLVPTCIGTPLVVALVRGELKQLFAYEDHPEGIAEKEALEAAKNKKEKKESKKEKKSN
jgi:minor histocompatibility antigen H13